MEKEVIRYAKDADASLVVWRPPASLLKQETVPCCLLIPVMSRSGGMLCAIPENFLATGVLLDGLSSAEGALLGPSRSFEAEMLVEDEFTGQVSVLEAPGMFLVLDLDDSCLGAFEPYDYSTELPQDCVPFLKERPDSLPNIVGVIEEINNWIALVSDSRLHFYSAREEEEAAPKAAPGAKKAPPKRTSNAALAEQVAALAAQIQMIAKQQEVFAKAQNPTLGSAIPAGDHALQVPTVQRLPALSAGLGLSTTPAKQSLALVGPPPKTKAVTVLGVEEEEQGGGGDALQIGGEPAASPIVAAISQQSMALTQLVAHLAGGDPIGELSSSSASSSGLNTKGVARREKMQAELAGRTSNFFMQLQQQLHKKMNPSRPIPQSEAELAASSLSMTSYMERYGGYRNNKEMGMAMWIASHAVDAASQNDFRATKEYLSLLVIAMEQATLDGNWSVASILSLLESPPNQVFQERAQAVALMDRPFSPLVPPSWAATALAYLKEIEVLTNRKSEMKVIKPAKGDQESPGPPSPKRRPKFPKKPKGASPDAPPQK